MKRAKIAILLLAAGASTRMGQIKQLLPWKGSFVLKHMIDEALASMASTTVVVLGAHSQEIKKALGALKNVSLVEHPDWERGMGSSIAAGTEYILKENPGVQGILILLADQPLIDVSYLNAMIEQFEQGETPIFATRYGDKGGVPALFGSEYFPNLVSLDEAFGARELLSKYRANVQLLDAGHKVSDMDTQAAYRFLRNLDPD